MAGTITALKTHPTRPGRVRVEIDGEYAFELSRKIIRVKGVTEGESLDAGRRWELEAIAAREAALLLLTRRERTRAELVTALRRKGFASRLIADVLDSLAKENLQSDTRFARAWVETRRRLAPRGRAALAFELKKKGVDDREIADTLTCFRTEDELADLREVIAARLPRLIASGKDRQTIKRRLLGFLSRRGFTYDDIRRVLATHFPDWA